MFKPLTGRGHAHRLPLTVLLALALVGVVMAASPATVLATTTFVVNKVGDAPDNNLADAKCDTAPASGKQCTLRAAIQEANDTAGMDTVNFKITSASKVIKPNSPLPPVTQQIVINGYSQPGATGNTLATGNNAVLKIVLDGINAGAGANGLQVGGSRSIVQGLVIQRFDASGVLVTGERAGIRGNFIGTDAAGTASRANGVGVTVVGSMNTVGGASANGRNVISGNETDGVLITGAEATGNNVYNSYIGTNKTGAVAVGNGGHGITVDGAPSATLGGTTSGVRNVISGNVDDGIILIGGSLTQILGNYIGTDATGTADLGNIQNGILLDGGTKQTLGGSAAGARNVVSGNNREGIYLAGTTDSDILGNLVGTDASGMSALGNGGSGLFCQGADGNQIGGSASGARNTFSGNLGGINLVFCDANTVQGNRIGTRVDGSGDLGNEFLGIHITGANNVIGGTAAEGNVIANTNAQGIFITGEAATGNVVRGNAITGNRDEGILIQADSNQILGNLIISNGADGILVDSGANTTLGVLISGNQLFANGGLGINLARLNDGAFGVTPNDSGDGDFGQNRLQNFPVLSSAVRQSNGATLVAGSLNSVASTQFRIELFLAVADASGHGEGQVMLASQNITTKSSGNKGFTFGLGAAGPGQQLTATAINLVTNDTSEFSLNVTVVQAP